MSAIGDTILTTPVACRLRDAFPDALIGWVVERKSSRFIVGHPAVDETIVLDRGWWVTPTKIEATKRRLSGFCFDVAVDCQSVTKSALACWLSGAKLRIGLRGQYGGELSPWLNNRLIEPRRPHLTDRSLEMLAPLGVGAAGEPYESVRWDLPASPGAEKAVARWAPADEPFAVINPGATWDSKLWEMERFGRVAERLGRERGLRSFVVWAGDREHAWARLISRHSGGWAEVAPATSLDELAALLRQARLMLSADTGPMHLAVAVGAPTVGLFGSTRPEDCGPYGAPHLAVQKRFQSGGRRARRKADNSAMREITVDDAFRACQRVLDRTAARYPNAPIAMAS
ncbi:glycosyltransferase family 9 protein [Botrimarina sp.]|uniref:glycosyltransferase family 9 protein n=1 Tax=Botrimarina sp. TaxID=2795802 RepID=UPI0032F087A3